MRGSGWGLWMGEVYPSVQIIVLVDLLLIAAAIITTIVIYICWREIRDAKVVVGAILLVGGLWIHAGIFAADLISIIVLPGYVGSEQSSDFATELHLGHSWYVETVSLTSIVAGILIIVLGLRRQIRLLTTMTEENKLGEQRLSQAAEIAKLGYYWWDAIEDKLELCNEQHARSHGCTMEEYFQKASTLENDMPLIHPDDREMVRAQYVALRSGKKVEFEYRVPTSQGERRIREIALPIFDQEGRIVREVGTTLDITEQSALERRLNQAEKLETIGRLTGGVAHDFNNLLAIIMGNLEFLKKEEQSEASQEYLDTAMSATERGAELTRNMLAFARQSRLDPVPLDLNQVIRQTKNWLSRTLPATIDVETSLLANLWQVEVDRASTQSALLNLILNARDAMPDGGKLTIETANVRIDDEYVIEREEDIEPGRYVMVAVSDTGAGISNEELEHIFEPFYSTKGVGQGTGLGLAMVQGFLKQSTGTIRVYSELNIGTTFKLYFPARETRQDSVDPVLPIASPASGDETTILIAEDDADVLKVVAETVRSAGYRILTAQNGDEALAIFERRRDINLLLTDIVMPGSLQGPQLARQVREIQPDLPVIFMSGYASEATVHGNGLRPSDVRLMKPVRQADLVAAIQTALAARKTA